MRHIQLTWLIKQMTPLFLTAAELKELTGFTLRDRQISHLRKSGIPFIPNAHGKPVVTRYAVEGRPDQHVNQQTEWQPKVLQSARKRRK